LSGFEATFQADDFSFSSLQLLVQVFISTLRLFKVSCQLSFRRFRRGKLLSKLSLCRHCFLEVVLSLLKFARQLALLPSELSSLTL